MGEVSGRRMMLNPKFVGHLNSLNDRSFLLLRTSWSAQLLSNYHLEKSTYSTYPTLNPSRSDQKPDFQPSHQPYNMVTTK